jgi:uncharacterized repeat protein (TIGR01451 family)
MFEKLLSLLPYNPGLTHQMAFYSRRMREEAAIRRTGLIFLVLAFMVQFFAVLSPPQPTVADSSNDLVNGGISSAADAARNCRDNVRHYKEILDFYGISCNKVAEAETVSIKSTDHDGKLYSMGWNPQGQSNNNTGRKTNETMVNIDGISKPLYWRLLHSWDSNSSSTYTALKLHSSDGNKTFWILFNCGNLVTIGVPSGQPTITVTTTQSHPVQTPTTTTPVCQYNAALPATSPDCFAHCPIPGKTNLPQNSPQCYAPCPYNSSIPASSSQCFQPCEYNHSIPATSPQCFKPCEYNSSIPANSTECKPCDKSTGSNDFLACIIPHKAATNITTGASDANGTTANANDVIEYTLTAGNSGKADIKNFVFAENLSDVLDYADVVDLHGGVIDTDGQVSWQAETIKAGATASHKITVKVKAVIPQTPASSSDPMHFDLTMTNVYGNAVNIKLPGSPAKTIQTATTSLPNTGPGATLLLAAFTVIIAGYFYARSELLSKESTMALHEMATA